VKPTLMNPPPEPGHADTLWLNLERLCQAIEVDIAPTQIKVKTRKDMLERVAP